MQPNNSDSDFSSDSSWTIVHGPESVSRTNSFETVGAQNPNDQMTKGLLNEDIEASKKPDTRTMRKNKKKTRKSNKSKLGQTDYTNLLAIIACLFTITGITLLTTFLPPNFAESADLDSLQNHLAQVYEHSNNPTTENAANSIQAALDAMETATSADLLITMADDFNTEEPTCQAVEYYNNSDDFSKLKVQVIAPYTEQLFGELSNPVDLSSVNEKVHNNTKSLYESAKSLLKNPSLQMFVATLIQDVCLIKLISEFSKRTREEETEHKTVEVKKARKLSSLVKKKFNKPKKLSKSKLLKAETETVRLGKSNSMMQPNENGKSECERRFEELDSRWSTLGQNHRQKIQQIKSKFQQEIFQIKKQEEESLSRKQKIDFTREKFLQRLKSRREVYLHMLRKLRDEKQKVLSEVCHSFKTYRNLSSKDVSVGNFAVLLPSEYSFTQKLEEMKSKERNNLKLQAVNNESISYVPTIAATASSSKERNKEDSSLSENRVKTYDNLRKKYEKKRASLLKKRHAKKQSNMKTSLFQDASKFLLEPEKFQPNIDQQGFQKTISKKKASKRNLNQLYDAAFDHESNKIKKQDLIKWSKNFPDCNWTTPDITNKHIHRQKIVHKGLL